MKARYIVISILAFIALVCLAATVERGLPISQYPNNGTPNSNALFVMAMPGVTNQNISFGQLAFRVTNSLNSTITNTMKTFASNLVVVLSGTNTLVTKTSTNGTNFYIVNADPFAITNGLATTNYANQVASNRVVVLSGTNTLVLMTSTNGTNFYAVNNTAPPGFAALEVQTNTVRLGLVTNLNWTYGVTGSVSGTTAILGVDDSLSLSNLSNNLSTTITVTSNFLATSSVQVATNDTMMVLQATPNSGSQWYVGANQTPATNGARGGFEFHSTLRALRMGDASGVQWNDTNTGRGSVNFGSNNIAGGRFTTIAGGRNNVTHTNVENSFIGGGINHTVSTNATNVVICGGENNQIQLDCYYGFIGGGVSHVIRRAATHATIVGGASHIATDPYNTIGGGLNNFISDESSGNVINSSAATISGGEESIARGLRTTISGGYKHNLISDCDYSVISGGSSNGMGIAGGPGNGTQFSVVAGGSQNAIGTGGHFSTVSGGQLNIVGAQARASIINGGVSNNIGASAVYAGIWGNWGTNSDAHTGLISYEKVTVRGRTNGTIVAASYATLTNRVAGAGTGSTNYTLLSTTSRMYLGSSNVNIIAVMRTEAGVVMPWTAYITNLSADTWGINFSSATNRWKFQSWMYGTNAPVVLTNNTLLRLNGESEGTNTLVTYEYFSPAL